MSIRKGLFGILSLSLFALVLQLPASAQTVNTSLTEIGTVEIESNSLESNSLESTGTQSASNEPLTTDLTTDLTFSEAQPQPWTQAETVSESDPLTTAEIATAADLTLASDTVVLESTQPTTDASKLALPAAGEFEEPATLAQARRRTRGTAVVGSDFIGIGADFGYAGDVSFAAISKFSFTDRLAARPSILVGDEFAILVPVTYDFSRFSTDIGGFQLRPYAGAGVSYTDSEDNDINLLLSAGVDVPFSQRFTLNAQLNYGVLNDSQFGGTVGVGYNLGNLLGR
ncbi:MAG: hypothetical protein WA783_20450 [Phormidesmis sp.]